MSQLEFKFNYVLIEAKYVNKHTHTMLFCICNNKFLLPLLALLGGLVASVKR